MEKALTDVHLAGTTQTLRLHAVIIDHEVRLIIVASKTYFVINGINQCGVHLFIGGVVV